MPDQDGIGFWRGRLGSIQKCHNIEFYNLNSITLILKNSIIRSIWTYLTITGGSCHKYHFCHDKFFVVTSTCLLRENTSFVRTKVSLPGQNVCQQKIMFVMTKYCCRNKVNTCLSWQKFCCDKHTFVKTKDVFCHDKHVSVATKVSLLQQNLSRQKWYLWQLLPIFNSQS